ncbi:hypothetical protein MNB_SV-15-729 [hydrothermal vent metagenome]|uniref:Uncharacterized protein n=1 Tax=hydrothermal vent metagenome TaxID=652676 RepID=A0A1W1EKU9_9ZZZZ
MKQNNREKEASLTFSEKEINIAIDMKVKLKNIVDMLIYMLDKTDTKFTIIIIKAEYDKLYDFIVGTKRDSDILQPINEKMNLHAIICQDTTVDGGYMFAKRILKTLIKDKKVRDVTCVAVEVRTTRYKVRDIIYKAFELYINARYKSNLGEIKYHSL